MVAPLLALGLGFQGLSRFRDFKKKEKSKAGIQGALDALLAGTSAGPLEGGLAGPPRPVGIGGNNLFGPQQAAIESIAANGNPAAALDLALKMGNQNLSQQNFKSNLGMQNAQFELSREQFELSQQKQDFFESQALRDDRLEDNVLALEAEAATNPFAAERLAGLRGEDDYNFVDPKTGATTKAFRRGTDEFKAAEGALIDGTNNLGLLNDLRGGLQTFGFSGDPASPITRTMESQVNTLQLAGKGEALFNLGAISDSDRDFLERFVPNITSLTNQFTSNPEALDAALKQASDIFQRANLKISAETRGWVGMKEAQLGARREGLEAQTFDQQTELNLLADAQARATSDDIGFFDIDERVRARFGDEAAQRLLDQQTEDQSFILGPGPEGTVRQLLTQPGSFAASIGSFFAGRFTGGK